MLKLKQNNLLFFAVMYVAVLIEWVIFKEQLGINYSNAFGTALKALGDVALILSPYWLLSAKWRWTSVACVWLYSFWDIANLAYFRFWDELIPVSAITMGGNVDDNLIEYGISLLRWVDICYLVIPALVTAAFCLLKPWKDCRMDWHIKLICIGVSLAAGCIGQFSYFKTAFAWNNATSQRSISEGLKEHFFEGNTGQKRLYTYNGLAYYGVRYVVDMIDLMSCSIHLTPDQCSEIDAFLKNYERVATDTDSLQMGERSDKVLPVNVVYIIVESLNSDMLYKEINGLEIMPTLDSLARLDGTVLFDNVVSQIKASSSSDGHLLLMTGLLPPDKVAYSITYGSTNKFPSIADVLPNHHKFLLLADDGVCWNEGNTLRNFGLGQPITTKDREGYDINVLGRDGAMFRQAADMVNALPKPFFMTLMTISMHIPFKEAGWKMPEEIAEAKGLDEMAKNYANVCHHTDRYIGGFLKSLPENSLVFIASDHSQGMTSQYGTEPSALFMAINTTRTERISRTVGQVNLFPATIDILSGIFGQTAGYGGLAPSAFNPVVVGSRDAYGNIYGKAPKEALDSLDAAFRISDLIIRGDYFRSDD